MKTARCEVTELLVGECAHCRGNTTTPDEEAAAELAAAAPWFHAVHPGVCAACGEPFAPGALIRMEIPRGWRADCCREDTP
ncbi:hypothetical protein [Streptomyces sp. NPDC006285]|uniref:hypothetical protein n=1 Tax=Streptomyces sp. NPDC006285 TaxID=3364742 RepID=UPI00369BB51F